MCADEYEVTPCWGEYTGDIFPTGRVPLMESRMIGQCLRSNPKGLALTDQTGRHTLIRPVGKSRWVWYCPTCARLQRSAHHETLNNPELMSRVGIAD